MSIRHAILGLLQQGPLHGYGLKAAYDEHLVPGASLNIGQVYPALDKLQADGHVTVDVVPQSERADRKIYTITAAGRQELAQWLGSPSRSEGELRNETFLKIALACQLQGLPGQAGPLAVLDTERRATLERLHELTSARDQAERQGAGLPALMLLDLAIFRLNAFHQWLDRCEELLRREGGQP